jgi:hypothetical protein
MATCPLCLFASPPGAEVCGRCGRFRFPPADAAPGTVPDAPAPRSEVGLRTLRGTLTVPGPTAVADPDPALVSTPAPVTVAATALASGGALGSAAPLPPPGPRLVVIRGQRIGAEYPVYDGKNYIGRSADKPVDIDLNGQEAPDQVWASRQHAVLTVDRGAVRIEDLNSLNGTFVNRARLHPGQQRILQPNDVVQVGTVQFRVVM